MGKIKVDKGIPFPQKAKTLDTCGYPFVEMEVGDSFFVEGQDPSVTSHLSNWICVANQDGKKFSRRMQKDEKGYITGYRVWRVK